jgi:hypothetical protein
MTPSALDALVCGYSRMNRAQKVLVMITGTGPIQSFVDESEGAKEGKILLLSACVHRVSQWTQLSDDWQVVLDTSPSIRSFHMREARSFTGSFAGWKSLARDLKLIALTEVILRHRPHVISCWVSREDYNDVMRGSAPFDLRNAYFQCFAGIVIKVAEYLKLNGITVPADYVFDEKGDTGNEALLWYAALKDGAPPEIRPLMGSTPVFRDDEDVLPLQVADLIAWHKRREKENPGLDTERAATMRIDELPGGEIHLTRKQLEAEVAWMSRVPNVELTLDGPSVYQKLKYAIKHGKKEI